MNETEYSKWSNAATKYATNQIDIADIKKSYHQMFHHNEG
jgi:hypothetical protein